MTRLLPLCTAILSACAIFQPSVAAQALSPPKAIAFDVASIKPIATGGRPTHGWVGVQPRPDGVQAAFQTLPDLLCYAYGYKSLRFDGQISGLPAWAATQRYDIEAKMSPADLAEFQKLSKDEQEQQRQAMMQSLLTDRFHMTLHRGSKEVPVYELAIAKGGIKMQDAATDPNPPLKKGDDGKPLPGVRWLEKTSVWQAQSVKSLADMLSMPAAFVGRPVVDRTGLSGTYDFALDWSVYSAKAAASDSPTNDVPSIFTAVGEIGLKLQPATASMETLVIDHADPPTEN